MRSRTSGSTPAARSSSQRAAVRRSCHTIARWRGRPVRRSHTTTVSRWSVMPMPTTASPSSAATTSPRVSCTARQISSGSCSTQPGRGKCCGQLAVREGAARAVGAHRHRAHAGRAGIDGEDDVGHVSAARRSVGLRQRRASASGAPGEVASGPELEHVRARRLVGREDLQQEPVVRPPRARAASVGDVEHDVAPPRRDGRPVPRPPRPGGSDDRGTGATLPA